MAQAKQASYDEELRDVLIAISVIAKRLADRLEQNGKTEVQDGQEAGNLGGN